MAKMTKYSIALTPKEVNRQRTKSQSEIGALNNEQGAQAKDYQTEVTMSG